MFTHILVCNKITWYISHFPSLSMKCPTAYCNVLFCSVLLCYVMSNPRWAEQSRQHNKLLFKEFHWNFHDHRYVFIWMYCLVCKSQCAYVCYTMTWLIGLKNILIHSIICKYTTQHNTSIKTYCAIYFSFFFSNAMEATDIIEILKKYSASVWFRKQWKQISNEFEWTHVHL